MISEAVSCCQRLCVYLSPQSSRVRLAAGPVHADVSIETVYVCQSWQFASLRSFVCNGVLAVELSGDCDGPFRVYSLMRHLNCVCRWRSHGTYVYSNVECQPTYNEWILIFSGSNSGPGRLMVKKCVLRVINRLQVVRMRYAM